MGIFVDYPNNSFSELKNIPTEILYADTNPILVNSITICNRGENPIRVNLQQIRTGSGANSVFLVNEFEVGGYKSVDLLSAVGIAISLDYGVSPNFYDSLECFSNGYTQIFDCTVYYVRLNDLPLSA